MALSLKNSRNCQSNDKVAPFLNRLVAVGAGHRVIPNVSPSGQLLPPSEYDQYVEAEQWSKVRHERSKDLVLTFGEDEVKVFKRTKGPPEVIIKVEHEEEIKTTDPASGATKTVKKITTRERVDVSSLKTVALPRDFACSAQISASTAGLSAVNGSAVPRKLAPLAEVTGVPNHAEQERHSTSPARTTTGTSAGMPSRIGPSPVPRVAGGAKASQPAAVVSSYDPNAPPPFIPARMWQQWIHARCRERGGPDGSTAFLDRLQAETAANSSKKNDPNRRRRRHHRLTCIYHLKSTNNVARQMGRSKLFPTSAIHQSYFRVQHAIHGATIHEDKERAEGGDDPEQCFTVPDMCEIVSVFATPPPLSTARRVQLPNSSLSAGGAQGHTSEIPELSAIHSDVPLPTRSAAHGGALDATQPFLHSTANMSFGSSGNSGLYDDVHRGASGSEGVFSMTQPSLRLSRACTPNLAPFAQPAKSKSLVVHGEFADCSCTDRSTDDEATVKSEIADKRAALKKEGMQQLANIRERRRLHRQRRSGGGHRPKDSGNHSNSDKDQQQSDGDHSGYEELSREEAEEERRTERLALRQAVRDTPEPMLADTAAKALQFWQDRFRKSTVVACAGLTHRLSERERHRAFVSNERTHLHLLSRQAEREAGEIALVRQTRSSTPAGTSLWAPIFDSIEGDRRYMSSAQDKFISFCDFCVSKQFPSTDDEMAFILELRNLCVADASSKPSSTTFLNSSLAPTFRNEGVGSPASQCVGFTGDSVIKRKATPLRQQMNASLPPMARARSCTPSGHARRERGASDVIGGPVTMISAAARRQSRAATVALHDVGASSMGVVGSTSGNGKSLFFARAAEEGTKTGGVGGKLVIPVFDRFNEATAMEMFVAYGPVFVRSRGGVAVANHLREECRVSSRDFLQLFYSHEDDWGPFCPEMAVLKKRINQATM